ncbi:MAG: hypothetical protein ACREYE_33295 [Gammaproteobacteria bacterium]
MIGLRKRALKHNEIDRIRGARGRSMLLFITDRCPVGCAHCSVDSRPNSATISDFDLFNEIVDWICKQPSIEVVGISGGEPFTERRGLLHASRRFAESGKVQVVFTSGVWAKPRGPSPWVNEVLAQCSCVYLSTDAFHAATVSEGQFVRAAIAIAGAGAWIVVQVLDHGADRERAEKLLRDAFGEKWSEQAELNVIQPLTNGRGASLFQRHARVRGLSFGACSLVRSPMVRYDGLVTGCCNESVIQNLGPSRLRRRVTTKEALAAAVYGFHADSLLRAIGAVGLGALTEHPRFADLAERQFASNCQLCWEMLNRTPDPAESDPLIDAIAALEITT